MCAFRAAFRRTTAARARRRVRIPGWALLVVPGCLAGAAAVVVSALSADGAQPPPAAPRSAARPAAAHTAPRPAIVPRSVWLTGDAAPDHAPPPRYDDRVLAVFVHHTDSPNAYDCSETPRIIRYLYAGQTGARDWDDIGYNFLVDRCGVVYEGRAGGVDRPVTGAHTQGFNHRTAGIAAIGTFTEGVEVPRAMTDAIAAVAAWKLGLSDTDPRGTVRLVSSNSHSRFSAGTAAVFPALAGHTDAFMTSCPGASLSARLPEIRLLAARLQGRTGDSEDRELPGVRQWMPWTPPPGLPGHQDAGLLDGHQEAGLPPGLPDAGPGPSATP